VYWNCWISFRGTALKTFENPWRDVNVSVHQTKMTMRLHGFHPGKVSSKQWKTATLIWTWPAGCQHLQKLVDFLFWIFLSVHRYRTNQLIPIRKSIGTSLWWKLNGFWNNPEPFCAHAVFWKGQVCIFNLLFILQ
jgi:hypothetical protein